MGEVVGCSEGLHQLSEQQLLRAPEPERHWVASLRLGPSGRLSPRVGHHLELHPGTGAPGCTWVPGAPRSLRKK